MRKKVVWVANGTVMFITTVFLLIFLIYGSSKAIARQNLPGTASPTGPTRGLAFATFVGNRYGVSEVSNSLTIQAYSVDEAERILQNEESSALFTQSPPSSCEADQIIASPSGRFLIAQYLCHADTSFYLSNIVDLDQEPIFYPRSYFLNWSPDGDWLLLRKIDQDQIWLISADGQEQAELDLPMGTYDATFTPDGQRVVYTASRGLGFGSELGLFNLVTGERTVWQTDPYHVFAFPTWAPDGSQLAYIRMNDSNIPFTIGELWLADSAGQSLQLLHGQVDAGRGFSPAWSPDGRSVAFVRRENPDAPLADHDFHALHSNIYQVDVATSQTIQLTNFSQSMVYEIAWSPDGRQLAFTVQDAVWVVQPGQEPIQASQPDTISRHPVWLVEPASP